MAGRLAKLIGLIALTLAVAGCDHLEPLRQGILSTYGKELRQLADDIDRKELAKITGKDGSEETAQRAEVAPAGGGVQQVQGWHAAPLAEAVRLQPPVSLLDPAPDP